jgi:Spy/CpxP family protein refolding chaperone
MRASLISGFVAAALMSSSALAQTSTPSGNAPVPETTNIAPKNNTGHWRSSKLIGVNIYNEQNDKLGDISEIILDPTGKVTGYVVGIGGFLGMGEHDILVEPTKIKFVNEPVRSAATAPSTGTAPAAATADTPSNTRNVSNTSGAARAANEQWYPDHGVLNTTKDQLKAMPQFKYSTYN